MLFLDSFIRLKPTRLGHKLFRAPWAGRGNFRAVPHTIWIYWADGRDQAPPLVKLCIRSWEVMNPGWDVVVLDETNLADYADLSDLEAAEVPIQKRSNILRCRLLMTHGGVWADGTILCTASLDGWLFAAMQSDAFIFSRPAPYRIVSSWFMAAQPDSRIMTILNQTYTRYLTDPPVYKGKRRPPYFNFHFTIEYLYRTNRAFRAAFKAMPKIWATPLHSLQRDLQDPDGKVPPADVVNLPMQKFSWRKPLDWNTLEEIMDGIDPRLGQIIRDAEKPKP